MSELLNFPDARTRASTSRTKTLVFDDPLSKALLEKAERVAASDASVLIVGETGTGKELLARHVHACSGRRGPFVAVNCGAFNEHMVEAELFGHEAGAYTGATQARAGWFEAARHGTLFLDEIGDLPLSMQVKLLRVLQERQVVRLGSRQAIDVDVRLIVATNVQLERAVESGAFRRDLYYRLNIAALELAPLAQRPADILALAGHFIAVYGKRLGVSGRRLSSAACDALQAHDWPGNIRELENVIHYALIVGTGDEITAEALNLRTPPAAKNDADLEDPDARHPLALLRQALHGLFEGGSHGSYAAVERETIAAAYLICRRNQVHAAELLGISRNVLRAQLKRFGFLPDRGRRVPAAARAESPSLQLEPCARVEEPAANHTGVNSWAA